MLGQVQVASRWRGRRWIETILSVMLCALWSVIVLHLYAVLRSILLLDIALGWRSPLHDNISLRCLFGVQNRYIPNARGMFDPWSHAFKLLCFIFDLLCLNW